MLDKYPLREDSPELKKQARIAAVAAALEIAKASVASTTQRNAFDKVQDDMKAVSASVMELADAIQAAMEK